MQCEFYENGTLAFRAPRGYSAFVRGEKKACTVNNPEFGHTAKYACQRLFIPDHAAGAGGVHVSEVNMYIHIGSNVHENKHTVLFQIHSWWIAKAGTNRRGDRV